MALPNKEEVAAIRKTLFTPSCHSPTPDGHTLKSRDEALRLKELGNNHFRKKHQDELCSALQCYTKVAYFSLLQECNTLLIKILPPCRQFLSAHGQRMKGVSSQRSSYRV